MYLFCFLLLDAGAVKTNDLYMDFNNKYGVN